MAPFAEVAFEWPQGLPLFPAKPQAPRPLDSEWSARLVMSVHAAGLLIGRGGKRIKLLQEDSGAHIQFHADPEFGRDLRVAELRGPPAELQDGLELLVSELGRLPSALAPKIQLMVPEEPLASECLAEARKFAAAVLEPCEGGQLLVLEPSNEA
ncbi:unnamed protein product, partial [Effrenium voratum]